PMEIAGAYSTRLTLELPVVARGHVAPSVCGHRCCRPCGIRARTCQSAADAFNGYGIPCRPARPNRSQAPGPRHVVDLEKEHSGAERWFFPAGREDADNECVRFVNRRVIEADLSPAATGSPRRSARYAPRAASEKGPTPAEREASPCAKPG